LIRAVVFDLGGVVFKGSVKSFLRKGEKIVGKIPKNVDLFFFDKKLILGTSSHRAAFERIFGKKFSDEEFIPLMKAWMNNWEIDESVLGYAKALKKKYKLVVLSNSEKGCEEKFDKELKKVFSPILYSHRERLVKPNREFFELALKKLGLKAEECVMVDNARENEKACRELGIHFVHFKNLEKLKKDLELHGVRA